MANGERIRLANGERIRLANGERIEVWNSWSNEEVEKMRKGLIWIVGRGLGFVTVVRKREVEKMRKGLSIIAGIAIMLFAYSVSAGVHMDGLVSWWKLDETSGITAYDTEGSATNNGTLGNYGTNGTWTTTTAGSASSGALYFNASNTNYVDCGHDSSLDITNQITIEAWVKPNTLGPDRGIVVVNARQGFYTYGDWGRIRGWIRKGDDSDCVYVTSTGDLGYVVAGEWTHIAQTYDGDTLKLWMNGVNVDTESYTGSMFSIGSDSWTIGSFKADDDRCFGGTIDDVRIYNKALSEEQIQGNYDAIPEPSTLLLLGAGLLGSLALRRRRR